MVAASPFPKQIIALSSSSEIKFPYTIKAFRNVSGSCYKCGIAALIYAVFS